MVTDVIVVLIVLTQNGNMVVVDASKVILCLVMSVWVIRLALILLNLVLSPPSMILSRRDVYLVLLAV